MFPQPVMRGMILWPLALTLLIFSASSFAAKVAGVKGKRLLINLEGEPAKKGDIFYLKNPAGKRTAIIKIMAIKGDKALAVLGKGRAQKGYSLEYRPGSSTAQKRGGQQRPGQTRQDQEQEEKTSTAATSSDTTYWGIIAGFSMNSMDVDLKDQNGDPRDSVSMSGSGFSLKAFFDYKLIDSVWFRGFSGIETFTTSGDAKCGDASPFTEGCETDIMYLSLDPWGRYVFSEGNFRPWVGVGFSLLFPLSKTSTALDESSITNTSVMSFGVGLDWFVSPTFFVPVTVEYGLLPSSDDVSANMISLRAGAGFSF